MTGEGSTEELVRAQTRVWNYALGCIKPMSLMVAIQLGIPDAVHAHAHAGPVSLPDLASAVGVPQTKVPALRRLMRALSCFGVFARDVKAEGEGAGRAVRESYLPTDLSRLLAGGSPTGGAPFLLHGVHRLCVTPWYSMAAWFRGEGPEAATAFVAAHGKTMVECYDGDAEFNALINGFMAGDSRWTMGLVARKHPEVFHGLTSLVDVGGSHGESVKAIKAVFPEIKCTVLDIPHIIAEAPAAEGVDFVAGDMFEHIPPADCVLLKWVLLSWDDDDCAKILRRCKEAIPTRELGGKVIILEIVLGSNDGDHELVEVQHLFDLQMLVVTDGGRERNEADWRRIFTAAGFDDCKITPVLGPRSIIEVFP